MWSNWAWGQFALVGAGAACVFAIGARGKGIAFNKQTAFEIAQAVVIVVLLFALLSDGRGCSRSSTLDPDALCVGEPQC